MREYLTILTILMSGCYATAQPDQCVESSIETVCFSDTELSTIVETERCLVDGDPVAFGACLEESAHEQGLDDAQLASLARKIYICGADHRSNAQGELIDVLNFHACGIDDEELCSFANLMP